MSVSDLGFRKKVVSIGSVVVVLSALVGGFILLRSDDASAKLNFIFKDAPKAGVVAKIAGVEITEEALIGEDKLDFFELQKREYDLKIGRVKALAAKQLIGNEAKKAGLSIEDFKLKKILAGGVKVSPKDYDKFVKAKGIPEGQINPQIKEKIMAYLQATKGQEMEEAYVAKLSKGQPIEVYFKKPKMQINVEAGDAPFFGGKDAAVTIVEFSDFQCPFCSRGAATVNELKKKYGNKIKVAFKQFPLPMHSDAKPTSEASLCVNEQGTDKFWKFHDHAFKNQAKLDKASLEKYAKDSGADVKKFNECITSKKYEKAVEADMKYGDSLGVRSTPTFFVNGQLLNGALPIETFSEIIDEELSSKKGS